VRSLYIPIDITVRTDHPVYGSQKVYQHLSSKSEIARYTGSPDGKRSSGQIPQDENVRLHPQLCRVQLVQLLFHLDQVDLVPLVHLSSLFQDVRPLTVVERFLVFLVDHFLSLMDVR
jgi:hypothetical protein